MKRTHLSFSKQVVGEKWNYNGFMRLNNIEENSYYRNLSDEDGLITWPPKNYSCSFCHREFKSAQALGGHMNVHRRDRARLRQLPPWIFDGSNSNHLNPNSNSNSASSSTSSPCAGKSPAQTSFCKLLSPRYGDLAQDKNKRAGQNCELAGDLKRGEVVSLDLEMGFKDPQSLDLELRLGSLN